MELVNPLIDELHKTEVPSSQKPYYMRMLSKLCFSSGKPIRSAQSKSICSNVSLITTFTSMFYMCNVWFQRPFWTDSSKKGKARYLTLNDDMNVHAKVCAYIRLVEGRGGVKHPVVHCNSCISSA